MRAGPRQPQRQGQRDRCAVAEQLRKRGKERHQRDDEASPVDKGGGGERAADGERCQNQQDGGASERDGQRHCAGSLSRTPRPRPTLPAFSPITSMPAASSAPTSFISESTLP